MEAASAIRARMCMQRLSLVHDSLTGPQRESRIQYVRVLQVSTAHLADA